MLSRDHPHRQPGIPASPHLRWPATVAPRLGISGGTARAVAVILAKRNATLSSKRNQRATNQRTAEGRRIDAVNPERGLLPASPESILSGQRFSGSRKTAHRNEVAAVRLNSLFQRIFPCSDKKIPCFWRNRELATSY